MSIVTGASTNLTVTISMAQPGDVVISLASSDSGAVTTPSSVVIPAGATSASFGANGQAPGSATLTAALPGSLGGGTSNAVVTVNKADTTLNISANPNPATAGQQVTVSFTTAVTGPGSGTPAGTVTISNGAGTVCSGSAPSGSCAFTASSIGTSNLTGTYGGDSNFNGSSSAPLSLTVNPLGISLAPPSSCSTGASLPLTATISAVEAGDTVVSLSSSSPTINVPPSVTIPAGSLSNSFSVTHLLVGSATITAALPGPVGGGTATATVRFVLLTGC